MEAPKTRAQRIRNWCGTLNNYTEQELDQFNYIYRAPPTFVSYLIYGKEIGDNGTPHLQFYIELITPGTKNNNLCHTGAGIVLPGTSVAWHTP